MRRLEQVVMYFECQLLLFCCCCPNKQILSPQTARSPILFKICCLVASDCCIVQNEPCSNSSNETRCTSTTIIFGNASIKHIKLTSICSISITLIESLKFPCQQIQFVRQFLHEFRLLFKVGDVHS